MTESMIDRFKSVAKSREDLATVKRLSVSETDRNYAVLHSLESQAFHDLSSGKSLDEVVAKMDADWREFAKKNLLFEDQVCGSALFLRTMYKCVTQEL